MDRLTLREWIAREVRWGTDDSRRLLCTFFLGAGMPPDWVRGLADEFGAGRADEVLRLVEECTWYRADQDITAIVGVMGWLYEGT